MTKATQTSAAFRKALFMTLLITGFGLSSCESEFVDPKKPLPTYADDDPPKDNGPIRPPSGGGSGG